MSVIVKGMKMPKNCTTCRFSGFGGLKNERIVCMFTGTNDYLNQQERFDDCPLVEVPPHGDLIDRSKLPWNAGWLEVSESCHDHITFVYVNDLFNAPTIIEAEDES